MSWTLVFAAARSSRKRLEELEELERRNKEAADNAPFPDPASLGTQCEGQTLAFKWCLRRNVKDISKCQVYIDRVYQCYERSSESGKGA